MSEGLSLEQIGRRLGKHPSTVSYWLDKYGLVAVNKERHAARGGIEREVLEPMVEAGMTIAEIAGEVGLSKTAVRHRMRRYGLRSRHAPAPGDRERKQAAKSSGCLTVRCTCRRHGETDFVIEGRGYYRCKECRTEQIVQRRRRLKQLLVSEAGGCCCVFGYDKYAGSLAFHHLDPTQKRLGLATAGLTLSLEAPRTEASKCVLFCSNCHAEVEAGIITVPATVLRRRLEPGEIHRIETQ